MALRATQRATPGGTAVAYTAANNSDEFIPGAHTAILVRNASAGAVTVTIPTPSKVHDVDVAEMTVSVPAGSDRLIKPPAELVTASTGRGSITYSATASVTVAVVEIA